MSPLEEAGERAPLERDLQELEGGRIDAAHANLATGLVVLAVHRGGKRLLGVGIGPRVSGVGWLPRLPRVRASAAHPLVAAMRAHLVGGRIAAVRVEGGEIQIELHAGTGGEGARIELCPQLRGYAVVSGGAKSVRWPGRPTPEAASAEAERDLEEVGPALVDTSDRLSFEQERAAVARAITRRTAATHRRIAAIEADLQRLDSVERLQRTGRLLVAQAARGPRGATRAVLEDWETGGTLEVELDPARGAREQAEAFFAKARRYQRGAAVLRRRLEEATVALRALEELASEVARAPDGGSLDPLVARARGLGAAGPEDAAPARGVTTRRTHERRPFTRFRGAGEREIRVGRGAADNDALTTRHARPGDLWLHAKGQTGAHVVVPLDRGTSCPADLLVDAATLAAHFSDARGESVVEVGYAERRYVRKPRGSPPGAVSVDREKVIALRLEPPRLARLLASKEE